MLPGAGNMSPRTYAILGLGASTLRAEDPAGIHKTRKAACILVRGVPPEWSSGTLVMKMSCVYFGVQDGVKGPCVCRSRVVAHRLRGAGGFSRWMIPP